MCAGLYLASARLFWRSRYARRIIGIGCGDSVTLAEHCPLALTHSTVRGATIVTVDLCAGVGLVELQFGLLLTHAPGQSRSLGESKLGYARATAVGA
jgi:hypothetical protein